MSGKTDNAIVSVVMPAYNEEKHAEACFKEYPAE
jgi:glycosyltransferase involved in cell wall biosynthesis